MRAGGLLSTVIAVLVGGLVAVRGGPLRRVVTPAPLDAVVFLGDVGAVPIEGLPPSELYRVGSIAIVEPYTTFAVVAGGSQVELRIVGQRGPAEARTSSMPRPVGRSSTVLRDDEYLWLLDRAAGTLTKWNLASGEALSIQVSPRLVAMGLGCGSVPVGVYQRNAPRDVSPSYGVVRLDTGNSAELEEIPRDPAGDFVLSWPDSPAFGFASAVLYQSLDGTVHQMDCLRTDGMDRTTRSPAPDGWKERVLPHGGFRSGDTIVFAYSPQRHGGGSSRTTLAVWIREHGFVNAIDLSGDLRLHQGAGSDAIVVTDAYGPGTRLFRAEAHDVIAHVLEPSSRERSRGGRP